MEGHAASGKNATNIYRAEARTVGFAQLPIDCRVHIFGFLDQDGLVAMSLVSKQSHQDCWYDGNKNKIVRVYEISPSPPRPTRICGTMALLMKLRDYRFEETAKFALYQHMRVNRIYDFDDIHEVLASFHTTDAHDRRIRLDGILSLDISVKETGSYRLASRSTVHAIVSLLPNVREINCSRVNFSSSYGELHHRVTMFLDKTFLEKITWEHSDSLSADGRDFRNCTNLTDVFLDNSIFINGSSNVLTVSDVALSDLAGHPNDFLFSQCKSVERLSIRNAKWAVSDRYGYDYLDIPQAALVKFVRNAPSSLRWFRSNLTKENINELQKEHPQIEFLN